MNFQPLLFEVGLIGESTPMKTLDCQIASAASNDLTVLLTGESGTGKELVARAIHQRSSRAEKPFISFNCGALTESLLESELFGYEKGAFTGANQSRRGLFAAAHTGTIFLDEIGEMSPASQVKFLRVLQESAVRPIGSHNELHVDVRVIAATNRNLAREISEAKFREDLFYRIAVLTINLPALRHRPTDIPLLIKHFLGSSRTRADSNLIEIDGEALEVLTEYQWPGNVRELRNVVERLSTMTNSANRITGEIAARALTASPSSALTNQAQFSIKRHESLDDFLDRALLDVYEQVRQRTGSHARTAQLFRVDRTSLYQRIERARKRIQKSDSIRDGLT